MVSMLGEMSSVMSYVPVHYTISPLSIASKISKDCSPHVQLMGKRLSICAGWKGQQAPSTPK